EEVHRRNRFTVVAQEGQPARDCIGWSTPTSRADDREQQHHQAYRDGASLYPAVSETSTLPSGASFGDGQEVPSELDDVPDDQVIQQLHGRRSDLWLLSEALLLCRT